MKHDIGIQLNRICARFHELRNGIKNWLFPPAPWIALLGVDGSGKSTILEELRQSTMPGYSGLFVLHRRPGILYRPATNRTRGDIDHYKKSPHGPFLSIIKLGVVWLDWLLGYFLLIRSRQARKLLVVSDRHSLLDMIVDPLRYRYGNSPVWVQRVLDLSPTPDGIILLDAPTAVLLARKQEITANQANELRRRYLDLVKNQTNGFVIDASQPVAEVRDTVWQHVLKIEKRSV